MTQPTTPPSPASGDDLAPATLFQAVGGSEAVARITQLFYDRVEADPELRPLFPEDLSNGREKQRLFLEQYFGGPPSYSAKFGHPRLRRRHFPFVIGQRHAGRWLRHMTEALREAGVAPEYVAQIMANLGPLAHHMVNEGEDIPREPLGDVYLT